MGRKSKTLVLLIVSLFLTSLVLIPHGTVKAQTRTLVVPDQYPTIQDAVDNASAGDTVFVKKGTYDILGYYDGIQIDKSISLIGEDNQSTIINDTSSSLSHDVIHITADNVTISGFTINGNGVEIGVDVEDTYSHVPINCDLTGNNILNCGVGLDVYGSTSTLTGQIQYLPSYLTVKGNTFSGNNDGIYMSGSNSTICGNTISSNLNVGIIIDSCLFVNISNNLITNNGLSPQSENESGGLWLR